MVGVTVLLIQQLILLSKLLSRTCNIGTILSYHQSLQFQCELAIAIIPFNKVYKFDHHFSSISALMMKCRQSMNQLTLLLLQNSHAFTLNEHLFVRTYLTRYRKFYPVKLNLFKSNLFALGKAVTDITLSFCSCILVLSICFSILHATKFYKWSNAQVMQPCNLCRDKFFKT